MASLRVSLAYPSVGGRSFTDLLTVAMQPLKIKDTAVVIALDLAQVCFVAWVGVARRAGEGFCNCLRVECV